MEQNERRLYLINRLKEEQPLYRNIEIPQTEEGQKRLLRALFNTRPPAPADLCFTEVQDAYLKEQIKLKGITDIADLKPVKGELYLWQGDITSLKCSAIVNAANSALLGCFYPCHGCIDNAIHTYSGIQLRLNCARIMSEQGHSEPAGRAKITPAYNLPCDYVIHTVGPVISGKLTERDCETLASCYKSCLVLADEKRLTSIAFCCISTGEFRFPPKEAAKIAIGTVEEYKKMTGSKIKVIFNVFKSVDRQIYEELLSKN